MPKVARAGGDGVWQQVDVPLKGHNLESELARYIAGKDNDECNRLGHQLKCTELTMAKISVQDKLTESVICQV